MGVRDRYSIEVVYLEHTCQAFISIACRFIVETGHFVTKVFSLHIFSLAEIVFFVVIALTMFIVIEQIVLDDVLYSSLCQLDLGVVQN